MKLAIWIIGSVVAIMVGVAIYKKYVKKGCGCASSAPAVTPVVTPAVTA